MYVVSESSSGRPNGNIYGPFDQFQAAEEFRLRLVSNYPTAHPLYLSWTVYTILGIAVLPVRTSRARGEIYLHADGGERFEPVGGWLTDA